MKKKFVKVLSLYLFSSTCFACTSSTLDNLVDGGTPLVESSPALVAEVKATTHFLSWGNVGDTTIRVKADKDVLPALTGKKVDLAPITSNLEGGFRLLSVGGSLSAGFRDGGLYREGQLTAFPNLIARQMGVTFNQPLFDVNEGNGSGYKALVRINPISTFKMVTNNLGYTDVKAEKLNKFKGSQNDQYAFPEIRKELQYVTMDQKYIDRIVSDASKSNYKSALDLIKQQTADFVIFELGTDDMTRTILQGVGVGINDVYQGLVTKPSEQELLRDMGFRKLKGVVLNVPPILQCPYFTQFTKEKINKLSTSLQVQRNSSSEYYRKFDSNKDQLIPTKTVEKLLLGSLTGIVQLSDYDVLSVDRGEIENANPSPYNTFELQRVADEIKWPVVDVYSLYKKILAGSYVTDDGVAVNPDWVKGNFFSADGIYPTAFGQAVIANEVVKTINKHYKLTIPLVETRFFLKK